MSGAIGLSLYWLAGWLLISGTAQPQLSLPAPVWFGLCVFICLLGCVIMVAADVQKYVTLQLQRADHHGHVQVEVRHPNYLGEMMIYGSLALLAWTGYRCWCWPITGAACSPTNMVMKEASMSRYPQWAAYKQRSWWLVPFIF